MRFKFLLAAVVAFTALFSCAPSIKGDQKMGVLIDTAKVSSLVKGKTTATEVTTMFGAPANKAMVQDGEIWTYSYMEFHSKGQATSLTSGASTVEGRQQKLDLNIKDGKVVNFVFNDGPLQTMTGTNSSNY